MKKRPNIIFVMADDMGYGDFGMFNNGISKTPALDYLVRTGVCLTQHYSASCVCTPARAAFLTGRYPHRTGAIEMRSIRGLDRLSLREITIADVFKKYGYITGLIGKWHTGVYGEKYHPLRRGFDEFVGFRGGCMDYWNYRIEKNRQLVRPEKYLTDLFTEEACDFIRRHKDENFFLCVHYNAPHTPLQAPEEDIKRFIRSDITKGVSILYGMIYRLDKGIERLREEIKKQGIEENTLFLFTSDNGPQFGGEGEMKLDRFNCNFAGSKGKVYEGGIRVPMIIYWPAGGLNKGEEFSEFVHFTDWFPTLLAACKLSPPTNLKLDGINVLPALQGEKNKVNPVRFWQWNRYTPIPTCNAAMRDGDWKLVRPVIPEAMITSPEEMEMDRICEMDPSKFTGILRTPEPQRILSAPSKPELYNIKEDPHETINLADKYPEKVSKMLRALENWFEEVEKERRSIVDEE